MPTFPYVCGHCSTGVSGEIAAGSYAVGNSFAVKCPLCENFSVRSKDKVMYPIPSKRHAIEHLPDDVKTAWREVVAAQSAGASTAAEMMCRKILMHVAVDVAQSKPGRTFVDYVNDLDSKGWVPTGLKPKIDEIRQRGNIANHDLPASSPEDSAKTIAVTRHLLVSIYELPNS